MNKRFSKMLSLYLLITGIIVIWTFISYLSRTLLAYPLNFGKSTIGLMVFCFIVLLGLSLTAFYLWRSQNIFQWTQSFFNKTQGFWGIFFLLSIGFLVGVLIFASHVFASFRLIFLWAIVSLGFISLKLIYSALDEWKYIFISVFVFISESVICYLIQKFLFPLENYWIFILLGLFLNCVVECVLVFRTVISNLFLALDRGNFRLIDALIIITGPIIISSVIYFFDRGLLIFIFPLYLLLNIIHSCLVALLSYLLEFLKDCQSQFSTTRIVTWMVCLFSVVLIYSIAFFSLNTYPITNPLFEGGKETEGLWYTIPVNKSEFFPKGYARLEDSLFDDLGKPFVAILGQSLGLVEKCDLPGPEIRNIARISTDSRIQPKYGYTAQTMCAKWIDSLPDFFWRICLVGVFLLSLLIGIVILRNPIDFALISILFLVWWFIWPKSEFIRVGNVEVLISGMAFIGLIFPLIRRNQISYIVIWGLLSGFLFGMAGFVRQPSGFALLVTSIISIVLAGFQQRKLIIPILAICSLLIGNNILPAITNSLFIYRDKQLSITAPNIATRQHGSGFALLGGIGSSKPVFANSLDIEFYDDSIFVNIYNDNPLINFTQKSYEILQKTGQKLFFQYVLHHPMEFFITTLKKAWITFQLILEVPKKWPSMVLLLVIVSCLRKILSKPDFSTYHAEIRSLKETTFVFTLLGLISALPAILTSPAYAESTYLPAAVLSFTGVFVIYLLIKIFPLKKEE